MLCYVRSDIDQVMNINNADYNDLQMQDNLHVVSGKICRIINLYNEDGLIEVKPVKSTGIKTKGKILLTIEYLEDLWHMPKSKKFHWKAMPSFTQDYIVYVSGTGEVLDRGGKEVLNKWIAETEVVSINLYKRLNASARLSITIKEPSRNIPRVIEKNFVYIEYAEDLIRNTFGKMECDETCSLVSIFHHNKNECYFDNKEVIGEPGDENYEAYVSFGNSVAENLYKLDKTIFSKKL